MLSAEAFVKYSIYFHTCLIFLIILLLYLESIFNLSLLNHELFLNQEIYIKVSFCMMLNNLWEAKHLACTHMELYSESIFLQPDSTFRHYQETIPLQPLSIIESYLEKLINAAMERYLIKTATCQRIVWLLRGRVPVPTCTE